MAGERTKMSTHKLSHKIPEYNVWVLMRQRCNNEKNPAYWRYGGRGITICERWNSFQNFIDDMGRRPTQKHSLDRIDNSRGYCPKNCRWATLVEQGSNKRNNRVITHPDSGRKFTASQWERHLGLPKGTIIGRLYLGWSDEKALTPHLLKIYL